MTNKRKKIYFIIVVIILTASVFVVMKMKRNNQPSETIINIKPAAGSIETIISSTGIVLPKNRLEIKPPVNGRIESILVKEGDDVRVGQILAWMSSTERAALLDAARGQGQEQLEYWQDVYKPIALLAPIDGEVIVATTQPGQTVTTADAAVVLSDRLIVRAQVDETDIGKIKIGQQATLSIDAYPDTKIKAEVGHIYYESETVNNVTIYKVDLLPEETPDFFRSGMNATINFIENSRESVLLIPLEAVYRDKDQAYVFLLSADGYTKRAVRLGIADDKNIEVISGVTGNDTIIIKSKKYVLPKDEVSSNPFLPSRNKKK